jgi:hypothetical protein
METPKMYNFNGKIATWGEVNQKATKACKGNDYSSQIAELQIGGVLQFAGFGTIKRIAYP